MVVLKVLKDEANKTTGVEYRRQNVISIIGTTQ